MPLVPPFAVAYPLLDCLTADARSEFDGMRRAASF
jgi:hypothetical protein